MNSSAKLIERAVRFASDDLTKRAPLYTYWQYADGVFRNMVIGKTKDHLREHWQPSSAERDSQEWNQSIYELNAMAKAIFYDALEELYKKYEPESSDGMIRPRRRGYVKLLTLLNLETD